MTSATHGAFATLNQLASAPNKPGLVQLSRATIYNLLKAGQFPKPLRLSPRRVVWAVADIQAWLETKRVEALQ